MEILKHLQLLAFISCVSFAVLIHAQDQSGFISLDCGLPENSTYTESTTGVDYISDVPYIQTGVSKMLSSEFSDGMQQQAWHLRSFPEGIRNCYNITLKKGDKYLIRAYFYYGNYDEKNDLPRFDLYLGPNFWGTVVLTNVSYDSTMDIIHILPSNHLHLCLVNTGSGVPFISSIELRLLVNSTYRTQVGSLQHFARFDIAPEVSWTFRYSEDVYDRIWWPYRRPDWTKINSSLTMDYGNNNYEPPQLAMRSAGTPVNASSSLDFSINAPENSELYIYMHIGEVEELQANESRVFNISYNGDHWYGPYSPTYLLADTIYSRSALTGTRHDFSIYRTEDSTHPPILNAIEIYLVRNFSQSETLQNDVDAILNIKSMYGLKRSNWEGDPCAPQDYLWEGLNCSYNDPPRITSLDLSSSGLTGKIPSSIESLTQLEYLDLSNNNLTGEVPEFLSELQFLRVLNLEGNMLNGTVPEKLLERSNNGLTLRVEGNPNLCALPSCKKKKKKKVVVPIVAAVGSFSVLIIALATLWKLKRRKPLDGEKDSTITSQTQSLETRKRQFTYADVQLMTNNFERVLGKGGFGTVFHGYLDESTQVAVKMLSPSSVQGHKQFQAEVKLLLRVHHRNLTTLIGYCNEGTNLGLIYEYMAKGNLAEHLSARSTSTLSWEGRLGIAVEAAQGLEYLHNGCKPPIIHRDVKSTNILLNEDFQAKLADFGLSKPFPGEGGTHVSAVSIAGTPGYLDPEYYTSNRLTEKSDVYSFGIVLLEIITSRPVIPQTNRERTHISQWVSSMVSMGDIKSIVDPRLRGDYDVNSVWKAVEVAMACLSQTCGRRPTMNRVVVELSDCLSAERARNNMGGNGSESLDSAGFMSTRNLGTESTPLAR